MRGKDLNIFQSTTKVAPAIAFGRHAPLRKDNMQYIYNALP